MIKRLLYALIVMLACAPMAMAGDYQIKINDTDGGTVTVNKLWNSADAGDLIKVFIHPESDLWRLQMFYITREDDGSIIDTEDYYDPNYKAYSFTMPACNVVINATFVRAYYSITVNDMPDEGSATVNKNRAQTYEEVIVTVSPHGGYRATGARVVENLSGTQLTTTDLGNNQYRFVIGHDDVLVTPLFEALPMFLLTTNDPENGSVNTDEVGYEGDEMFIYTRPQLGYATDMVQALTETGTSLQISEIGKNSYSFIMPASNVSVSATFKLADYYVNISENIEHGVVGEATPGVSHHYGDAVTLLVAPDEDYAINHLTITDTDGNDVAYNWLTEGQSLTFNMPYNSVNVQASFKRTVYAIEIVENELGTVTSDVSMARVGDTVYLTVTPGLGCMFTDIKVEAGYEITGGGSGGAHAPLKAESLWYKQGDVFVHRIDETHFSFELPDRFFDDMVPFYLENTKFRVMADFKDIGPRVIWCEGNKTLYFDYDPAPQGEPRVGDTYDGQTITDLWVGNDVLPKGMPLWNCPATRDSTTRVVFKPNFSHARPTSCYYWFSYFKNLETIEGIEYLNTSEVTDMTSMFAECWSLKTIKVNYFDMSKVTSTFKMFFSCLSLTTIWCDNTWNVESCDVMFTYDDYLVGAAAYASSRIDDGSMANPTTGYFTSSNPVTVVINGNGTVDASEVGFPDEKFTFSVKPDPFCVVGSVVVTGNVSGNEINVNLTGGVYSFTMPREAVTITVTFNTPELVDAALWCQDASTLYFVRQPIEVVNGDTWNGQTITNMWYGDAVDNVGWAVPGWKIAKSTATKVVFDESFADARPKSCYGWFYEFGSMTTIEGLEYLNTSAVTNMNSMFLGCNALTTLDVNAFDVNRVTNATGMFRSCKNLTTIYCDSTWNIPTASAMFNGSTKLVGAVAYNNNLLTGSMANPKTGYFTGKWDVTVASTSEHVAISCEKTWAYTNETVTFTVTHDEGYDLLLTIETVDGSEPSGAPLQAPRRAIVDYTPGAEPGTYTFTMPAAPVIITAGIDSANIVDAVLWCSGNNTLYFVRKPNSLLGEGSTWDGQTINKTWTGDAVTNIQWARPGWVIDNSIATRVVFDESFADARPKSCYAWFYDFTALTTIEGLEYLNTSEVTNMNSMFLGCSKLTTLDVNTFDVSHVTNATGMFRSCNRLTTIYCDNTWNIATSGLMFKDDVMLVGAVPYNQSSDGGNMANPKTGYFTGKWDITIPSEFENGTVTCEKTWAYTNETVTLTVTPDEGYELELLTIETVDDGEPSGAPLLAPRKAVVDVTPGDELGTYTFKMPAAPVTVNAVFSEKIFTGIDDLNAAQSKTGQRYNLMGQPVGKDYKGIVIENGRKIIVR